MRKLITKDSFLLAAIPVIAFVLSLSFERGVASAYAYPFEFISIDLKVTIRALFLSATLAFPLYLSARVLIYLISSKKAEHRWLSVQIILPLPIILFSYLTAFNIQIVVLALASGSILLIVQTCRLLLTAWRHGAKNSLQRIAHSDGFRDIDEWKTSASPPTITDKIIVNLIFTAAFIFAFQLSSSLGKTYANLRKNYDIVYIENAPHAILSRYGDLLILGGIEGNKYSYTTSAVNIYDTRLGVIQRKRIEKFLSDQFIISRLGEDELDETSHPIHNAPPTTHSNPSYTSGSITPGACPSPDPAGPGQVAVFPCPTGC